jgi:16S rRNA (guanine1207-N2)-methyltransferase
VSEQVTGDHYFSADPSAVARPYEVTFMQGGRVYRLASAAGVFSAERLDPGTAVLLRKAPAPSPRGGVYLDLGCGYGPITCVLADSSDRATVYALDVNARALELVRRNAETRGVADRVIATTARGIPDDVEFDEIWSNPPIRVGKSELHDLLATWLPRLRPDGSAWLVIAKHLGGDSLQAWLEETGWSVRRHASQKGFRVLQVTRRDTADESPGGPEIETTGTPV